MALTGGGRTLVVNLVADTSRFGRSMTNARQDVGGFRGAINGLGRMAGPALLGVAAAAGALAVKFGVDGVKAALEEEQAVSKLSKTLENLGLGAVTQDVENYIDATQRATGVADDQLRPAFSRLVTSTGDAQKAQELLNVAIDTSIATGKPLETVVAALGKAADGSNGAISKLGVGIDAATLKSMSLDDITAQLTQKFGGSASANADTYAGRIATLSVGFDELKESFGMGFLGALGDAEGGVDDMTQTMQDLEPAVAAIGEGIGELITLLGDLTSAYTDTVGQIKTFRDGIDDPVMLRAFDAFTKRIWALVAPWTALVEAVRMVKQLMGEDAPTTTSPGNNIPPTNYYDTYGDGRPNNQYTGKPIPARTRSGFSKGAPSDGVVININTGLGDPVAIAREVERVLRLQDTRLGPS